MAELDPRECGVSRPACEQDRRQETVLAVILDAHPAQLSVDELVRELIENPDDFGQRDQIHVAVRELVGAGLLHRHGPFVFATRAAVRFSDLDA